MRTPITSTSNAYRKVAYHGQSAGVALVSSAKGPRADKPPNKMTSGSVKNEAAVAKADYTAAALALGWVNT